MMEQRLAIALAVHAGACRMMANRPVLSSTEAYKKSWNVMRETIPNLSEISMDLVYLLDRSMAKSGSQMPSMTAAEDRKQLDEPNMP